MNLKLTDPAYTKKRELSPERVKSIKRMILWKARKLGFAVDGEDIVQDVLLGFVEKPHSRQTVDQAIIDSIRSRYGGRVTKTNPEGKNSRRKGKRAVYSLHNLEPKDIPLSHMPRPVGPGPLDSDILKILAKILKSNSIDRIDHAVFMLVHGYGFLHEEVGALFDFTSSAAHLRKKKTERLMANEIKQRFK